MHRPLHQVLGDDVVFGINVNAPRAQQKPFVGGAEAALGSLWARLRRIRSIKPLCSSDNSAVKLRHDGVIVVAGIGDQRLGESDRWPGDAAVYPVTVFRGRPRNVAERTAGLDAFSFQRNATSRSLVRRSSFGASSAYTKGKPTGPLRTGFERQRVSACVRSPTPRPPATESGMAKCTRSCATIAADRCNRRGCGDFPSARRCVPWSGQCSSASIRRDKRFISAGTFGKCAGAVQRIDPVSLEPL